jgi:hypothetical protein
MRFSRKAVLLFAGLTLASMLASSVVSRGPAASPSHHQTAAASGAQISALSEDGPTAPGARLSVWRAQGGDLEKTRALVQDATEAPVTRIVVMRTLAGRSIVATVGPDSVCLRQRPARGGGGMACGTGEQLTDTTKPLINWAERPDGSYDVAALLTDEVVEFSIRAADGVRYNAAPVNNVAALQTSAAPAAVAWTTAAGREFGFDVGVEAPVE